MKHKVSYLPIQSGSIFHQCKKSSFSRLRKIYTFDEDRHKSKDRLSNKYIKLTILFFHLRITLTLGISVSLEQTKLL